MPRQSEISLVIPAYNEIECIAQCVAEASDVMTRTGRRFEIIVIDDGSSDGTFEALRGLTAKIPELRALRLSGNCGQTAAMEAGFHAATGEIIITLDADMQNDPADIPRLLELLENCDVVCGVRVKRNDSFMRRISSRIGNAVRNLLTIDRFTDTGCTLKVYRASFVRKLKLFNGMHRFLPTLLKLTGARVIETPVNHRPRLRGKSKYGIGNRMFHGLRDCLAVRYMKAHWIRSEIAEQLPSTSENAPRPERSHQPKSIVPGDRQSDEHALKIPAKL